ncbi:rRNA pseudouridine synthase [bacterium]|nr:rRNA pseudouridine synthase [bacterium]
MRESLRLNRFLATAGVASRRHCDDLIRAGRVEVNGQTVSQLGTRIDPVADDVRFDGAPIRLPGGQQTLVMNKPREVLVAASDTRGRTTVMDLLTDVPGRVFPVGRLDYRSEGLLLFTNDGDLAYRLTHPRFKVEKTYHVDVEGSVSREVIAKLARGVVLEDGPTQPTETRILRKRKTRTTLEMELKEGRKRQIRRMLALFGLEVTKLRRVRLGPLRLGDLPPGSWRPLEEDEIRALRRAVDLEDLP